MVRLLSWIADLLYYSLISLVALGAFKYITGFDLTIDLVAAILFGVVVTALMRDIRVSSGNVVVLNLKEEAKHERDSKDC